MHSGAVSSRQGRFAFETEHLPVCRGWTGEGRPKARDPDTSVQGSLELTLELEVWTVYKCRSEVGTARFSVPGEGF